MAPPRSKFQIRIGPSDILVFALACLSGCAEPAGEAPKHARGEQKRDAEILPAGDNGEVPIDKAREPKRDEKHVSTEPASANNLLALGEYKKFQKGRSKLDILNDVHWRGNFEMATEYKGNIVSAISYGLFGGPFNSDSRATMIWAVFVDDKFEKFVEWPEWDDKPIKIGDFRRLIHAADSDPLRIADLEKKPAEPGPPTKTNLGLAIVVLALRPALEAAFEKAVKRNAKLRDQYNASRLELGMTEMEVESLLRATPMASGEAEGGSFRLYGSTESPDVLRYLRYSNILVIFNKGGASGIYSGFSVPSGKLAVQELRNGIKKGQIPYIAY